MSSRKNESATASENVAKKTTQISSIRRKDGS
jgi:hypothetical protein